MSRSTEEYLEALYTLTKDSKTASTTAISKRLKIAPASVTEMMRKLADSGYVNYSPYQGVSLTPKGFEAAEKMTWKHRLLECFLHNMLNIGNERVHDEACQMEHALSDEAARALCQTLKSPDKCSDDKKTIPPCGFGFSSCEECRKCGVNSMEKIGKRKKGVIPMSTLKKNQKGKIAFIRGDNKTLRRLFGLGLTPGTKISISRTAPLKGPVEIAVRGSRVTLEDKIASNVFVEKTANEQREQYYD